MSATIACLASDAIAGVTKSDDSHMAISTPSTAKQVVLGVEVLRDGQPCKPEQAVQMYICPPRKLLLCRPGGHFRRHYNAHRGGAYTRPCQKLLTKQPIQLGPWRRPPPRPPRRRLPESHFHLLSTYKDCDYHWFCRLSTFPPYATFAGFEAEKATTGVKPEPRNGQTSETAFQRLSTDNVCTVRHSEYRNRTPITRSNSHYELITKGSYQAAWRTAA